MVIVKWTKEMQQKIWLQLLGGILLAVILFNYSSYENWHDEVSAPLKQGMLVLTEEDFPKAGIIKLDGEWEFYWQQLLTPEEFRQGEIPAPIYVNVPHTWKSCSQGEREGSDGYATYRLRIRLPQPGCYLQLKVPEVATAYKLYINGKAVRTVGTVSMAPEGSVPQYFPQLVSFYAETADVEVIIQVSNYAHLKGGLKSSLWLGQDEIGNTLRNKEIGFQLFVLGIFFILIVYHLGIYLLRPKEITALYFVLFCFLMALRTMTTGEIMAMSLFKDLDWELLLKIEYLAYYMAVPVFVGFMYQLYAFDTSPAISNCFLVTGIMFSAIVVFMPVKSFARMVPAYNIVTLLACGYITVILIKAIISRKEGARGFGVGVLIFMGTVINDILFSRGYVHTGEMALRGMFVFTFFQAMALSIRFSKAYVTLAEYNEMLKEQVRLLDLDPDYTIEHDLYGTIVFWNTGAEQGYKWSKEQAVGKNAYELLQTRFPQPLAKIQEELMKNGRWLGELRQTRQDGTPVIVRSCWLLKRGPTGQPIGVLEFNKDITAHKDIEREMARLERLSLIGQMAASISHEVRNPMTTVRGFLQFLAEKEGNEQYEKYYEIMLSEMDRANDILSEYLAVAKTRPTELRLQNLNDILLSLKPLLQAAGTKTGANIAFELNEVPEIMMDEGEIRQLILNLCRNGLDAMVHRGENLYITTEYIKEEVVITVRDEGIGIPDEIIGKLGTPFLTTKENGTGLGLTVCYGIIARHRATVEVYSSSQGTTFVIKFKNPSMLG